MLAVLATSLVLTADPAPPQPFSYFEGSWSCQGRFVPSGKLISSSLAFSDDTSTSTLRVAHEDRPPGTYKAAETWAFTKDVNGYRATIADAYSGLRWYTSAGWKEDAWTWEELAGPGEHRDSFVYRKLSARRMQVDWFISRNGQPLVLGDTLTCDRA